MENVIKTGSTPVVADISYATCKNYADTLSEHIRQQLIPELAKHGISPNTLFADLQTRPVMFDSPNPYKNLMNVLKQFAGVVMGGYTATILLMDKEKEIERLKKECNI